jgi:hypothetical protein
MNQKPQRLSLEEFKSSELPREVEQLIGRFNGGSFMECHTKIYEQTGIWIDELVPIFERLDATLSLSDVRPAEFRRG